MATSPIGTVFPAVAGSALVKVGIPTGDGFSMLEGSVPVDSLITPSSSGSWTPVVDVNGFDSASAITAYFIKVANAIHISIWIAIENTSLSDGASVAISLPEGYVLDTATLGDASFQGHYVSNFPKTEYPSLSRADVKGIIYNGVESAVSMQLSSTNTTPLAYYEGVISGIGILANQ